MVSFPGDGINENDEEEDPVDEGIVVLGRGPADNVKFEWIISDWTKCSQSCGNGIQVRTVNCLVRVNNNTQGVDNNLCKDSGLSAPTTVRKCGMDECPQWVTSDWSPCMKSKCFALNIAIQRRSVKCMLYNRTVSSSKCNIFEKPMYRQECENRKCAGKWKVGPWSKCEASCGTQGVKYRILQCVWYGTKKPAGMACKDKPRPPVMKSCKGPPCTKV
ncbi:ADAMTS cysteine-rich domain [Popillia japonica]